MTFPPYNFGQQVKINEHFLNTDGNNWNAFGIGANSIINPSGDICHPGISLLRHGTTATGVISLTKGLACIQLSPGDIYSVQFYANIITTAGVAQDYVTQVGFSDIATSDPTNGCYWEYNRAANGQVWSCITNSGSNKTTTIPSPNIVPSATYQRFGIVINGNSKVDFYNNNKLVATNTTNIPSTQIGITMATRKSAGTTNSSSWAIDQFIFNAILKNDRLL